MMDAEESRPKKRRHSRDSLLNRLLSFLQIKKKHGHRKHQSRYNLFRKGAEAGSTERTSNKRVREHHLHKQSNIKRLGQAVNGFLGISDTKKKPARRKPVVSTAPRELPRKKPVKSFWDRVWNFKSHRHSKKSKPVAPQLPKPAPLTEGQKRRGASKSFWKKTTRNIRKFFKSFREPLHNFLYFLNLRPTPYDPFLDPDSLVEKDSRVMRIQQYMVYAFNSTILFILSYIVAYLIYQMAVMFTASVHGIDSVLYYYEVMFPIGNASPLWNPFNIIMITLSGPMVSLLLGLVWYRVMMRRASNTILRLFYLWLSFHSFNMFFGAFVAGVITDQGFGYVANWLYLGIPVKMLLSMLALSVLGYFGWRSARHVLATSNNPQRINRHNRPYFVLNQTIIPWLAGSLLMLYIKIPNRTPQHENIIVYDAIVLGSLVFMAITPIFNWRAKPYEGAHSRGRKKTKFVWVYMVIALLAILTYRFGLERGLHIIFRIVFSVNFYN